MLLTSFENVSQESVGKGKCKSDVFVIIPQRADIEWNSVALNKNEEELNTKVAVLEHFLYLGHWGFLSDSELEALFSKRRVLFNGVGGRGGRGRKNEWIVTTVFPFT